MTKLGKTVGHYSLPNFIAQLDIAHTFTQPLVLPTFTQLLPSMRVRMYPRPCWAKKIWVKYWVNKVMAKMGKNLLAICWVYDLSVV